MQSHAIKNAIKFQYQNWQIWMKSQPLITERGKYKNKALKPQTILKLGFFFYSYFYY